MGISIWQLLIVLAIVLLLFGAKRLRSIGGDLGSAVKGFKQSMKDEPAEEAIEAKAETVTASGSPVNGWDEKAGR